MPVLAASTPGSMVVSMVVSMVHSVRVMEI
jgi:hypothetical protein